MKAMVIFIDKKQKYYFLKNPITSNNNKTKQNVIFQLCQVSIFFMVVRLSDASSKRGKNAFFVCFTPFLSLRRTA